MLLLIGDLCMSWFQEISPDIRQSSSTLGKLAEIIKCCRDGQICGGAPQELDSLEQLMLDVTQLHQRWQTIFMWHDGPLVQAMKDGSLFLVDEISLADDSVLERLNSVLEAERKLVSFPLFQGRVSLIHPRTFCCMDCQT